MSISESFDLYSEIRGAFYHYMTVSERFDAFLSNLRLTREQFQDGETKYKGVTKSLNKHYYGTNSDTSNSILVGSWGKQTRVRPPRDIDVLFPLPYEMYRRFEARLGNKQSQVLQEVKTALTATYPDTDMRGDGQVVLVPFASYKVEVVPAFKLDNGQYWVCNTNAGGKYVAFDPIAEVTNINASDTATNGNTRHLIQMMKCWQDFCTVPLKSFHIELLSVEFLKNWQYARNSTVYYDWLVRDFFKFLIEKASGYVFVPGTIETLWLGSDWKSRAESAYDRAQKACGNEAGNYRYLAGEEWQKIFGTQIPTG